MIQDIEPKFLYNQYVREPSPKPSDRLILYRDRSLLCEADEKQHILRFPELKDAVFSKEHLQYLFSIDEVGYYALKEPLWEDFREQNERLVSSKRFLSGTDIRELDPIPISDAYAGFTALHLMDWYHANRFCGTCGHSLNIDKEERAMYCPVCQKKIYPRINPAVIVGIMNGDRILISQYKRNYAHNALIAGFTEIGETVEQTVHREVMEETGLKVKHLRFYKSQPWGVAGELLMGFFCEVDGDDTIHLDNIELKIA